MVENLKAMFRTVATVLERQKLEAPGFYTPYFTQAARVALLALALFAALLAAFLAVRLVQRRWRQAAAVCAALAVAAGLCLWAYRPVPVADAGAVTAVEVRTRVPGKAEKTLTLTDTQAGQVVALLSGASCRAGLLDSLPYAGYGQTFRIFLTLRDGSTLCVYATPERGCRYTDLEGEIVYDITGYETFYSALTALGAQIAPELAG